MLAAEDAAEDRSYVQPTVARDAADEIGMTAMRREPRRPDRPAACQVVREPAGRDVPVRVGRRTYAAGMSNGRLRALFVSQRYRGDARGIRSNWSTFSQPGRPAGLFREERHEHVGRR